MRGDGIGADVTDAALAVTDAALARCGLPPCATDNIDAGASYFATPRSAFTNLPLPIKRGAKPAAMPAD